MASSLWNAGGMPFGELVRRTWKRSLHDRIVDQSAKLSFYFLLALFPLLMVVIALLGQVLQVGPALQENLRTYLLALVPLSASGLIDQTLNEVTTESGAVRISLALLLTWLPAARGMLAIMDGLNVAYRVQDRRPLIKRYAVASALTVVGLLLTTSALVLLISGGRLTHTLAERFGAGENLALAWQLLQWLIMLASVLLAFNLVYVYAPCVEHRRWQWLMPGTVAGVTLWLVVSLGFKLYLAYFNRFSFMYGSLGAVVVLMLWLYLSGIAILVGAVVNSEVENAVEASSG